MDDDKDCGCVFSAVKPQSPTLSSPTTSSPTPSSPTTSSPTTSSPTPSKSISEPASSNDSDSDSSFGYEYEDYLKKGDTEHDMGNTHTPNKELRTRDTITQFFKKVKNISSLGDSETRKWIGSLPDRMAGETIPLFKDDTGTDYQIHLCFSWMNALHTYSYRDSSHASDSQYGFPDFYVHSVFHTTNSINLESLHELQAVIPVGKLFINKFDRSEWTGYEVLINANLEIWAAYIVDDIGFEKWNPVECKLLPWESLDNSRDGQAKKSPSIMIAPLWDSLSTLEFATFNIAAEKVRNSPFQKLRGSFYLLEISTSEVHEAVKCRSYLYDVILKTSKLHVNVDSTAGCQLLSLIVEHVNSRIAMLTFRRRGHWKIKPDQTLLALATEFGDETIAELMLRQDKANTAIMNDVEDEMGHTPLLSAIQDKANTTIMNDVEDEMGHTPLLSAIQDKANTAAMNDVEDEMGHTPLLSAVQDKANTAAMNDVEDEMGYTPLLSAIQAHRYGKVKVLLNKDNIDKPNSNGIRPLLIAVQSKDSRIVSLLLEAGEIDVNAADNLSRTPLSLAAELGKYSTFKFLIGEPTIEHDKPGISGRTPLFFACRNGDESMVINLLRTGKVDPRRADNSGTTPLSWSATKLHRDLHEKIEFYDPKTVTRESFNLPWLGSRK